MENANEIDEIFQKALRGEIKLYQLDKILGDSNKATNARRKILEKYLGIKLRHIGYYSVDFNEIVGRNCENTIGVAQIPIGIAGPLLVNGQYARGMFWIPLATTEGALVASINRGCSAITASGGARTFVLDDKMTRAPALLVPDVAHAVKLVNWIEEHFDEIKRVFEGTSRFAKLIRIIPYIIGRNVFLRFEATTGDAMGMNMVTKATDAALKFIEEHNPYAKHITPSGNMCVDKKPSYINWLLGRGKTVVAEAIIRRDVCIEKLKTLPEKIVEVNIRKNLLGSIRAGNISFNAHFANIIAAIFIATGQDVAQVVESSMGITWAEVTENGDLYISITLPSLEVGTVGGGTHLPTQRECLEILGVAGGGNPPGSNARKFAEIVAAAVLAGELSLLAALAARHLTLAHELLGRGKIKKR